MSDRPSLAYSALPPELLLATVRFAHPATGRALQRLNKVMASLVRPSDLVWGEAGWRWHRNIYNCWQWAARKGDAQIALLMMDDPRIDAHRRANVLPCWAGRGHTDMVRLLLRARYTEVHQEKLELAFISAVEGGHVDCVRTLLAAGVNVGRTGYDALVAAAAGGHVETVKLLWEAGAKAFDDIPLWRALQRAMVAASTGGHVETVKLLLEAGTEDYSDNVLRYALQAAVLQGLTSVVDVLLVAGDVHGEYLYPVLELACQWGHGGIVKLLLDRGAATTHERLEVAMSHAAEFGREDIVRAFLDRDKSIGKNRALVKAARDGHSDVVLLLLKAGADVHYNDDEALKLARSWDTKPILQEYVMRRALKRIFLIGSGVGVALAAFYGNMAMG
ncbi:hypothetical protein HK104_001124 [Borealophlyctis nickersoniae]|nr:hypothetical protein HK104_001124 [Borealophlyctis nickersoniae]